MAGRGFYVGVAIASSIAVLGCARKSDERAEQAGGASSAGGAFSTGGELLVAPGAGGPPSTDGPAETTEIGVGGVGGNVSMGGAGGAFAGGAGLPALAGSGGALPQGGAGQSAGTTVSLDFAPTLSIANETLFFPVTGTLLAPTRTSPTDPSKPNELEVEYTRAGCRGARTETMGTNAFGVDDSWAPMLLTTVTISQHLQRVDPPAFLAETTCVTARAADGHWLPFLALTNLIITGNTARFEFAAPAEGVDAVTIYLPTYTEVSNISYTIHSP